MLADCRLRLWVDAGLTGETGSSVLETRAEQIIARVIVGLDGCSRIAMLVTLLAICWLRTVGFQP